MFETWNMVGRAGNGLDPGLGGAVALDPENSTLPILWGYSYQF